MIKIVIVDDEEIIREQIKKLIEKRFSDCMIDTYATGEALLRSGKCYDIVFLDIQMDGMNGIDTAKELRKKAVGWAFSSSTTYPKNNGVSEYLALMIEDSDDSFRKYWVHIDPLVFEMNFLKEYLDKRGISYEKAERMD